MERRNFAHVLGERPNTATRPSSSPGTVVQRFAYFFVCTQTEKEKAFCGFICSSTMTSDKAKTAEFPRLLSGRSFCLESRAVRPWLLVGKQLPLFTCFVFFAIALENTAARYLRYPTTLGRWPLFTCFCSLNVEGPFPHVRVCGCFLSLIPIISLPFFCSCASDEASIYSNPG